MCGIAGSIYLKDYDKKACNDFTKKAIREIIYRGPDDNSIFEKKSISLGSCRLAINDLRQIANMPMTSKCARYTLTYNGEIYNFRELRESLKSDFKFKTNSDTEVILNSYIKFGPSCFDKFQGMFALAIWDDKKKELVIARDRLGKKPLFFKTHKETFKFCSEINPLLESKEQKDLKLNKKFINEVAVFGEQARKQTAYKKIERLLPNKYLKISIKKGNFEISYRNYLSLLKINNKKFNYFSNSNLLKLLYEAVNKRIISDRPVGIALSGGIDSAVLCKIISESGLPKPPAFTIRFNKDDQEVERARLIAKKYKLDHHIVDYKYDNNYFFKILKKIGEPYCDPGIAYLSLICKNLPKEIKVLITGDGGDEAFLGYQKYYSSYIYNKIPDFMRNLTFLLPLRSIKYENKFLEALKNRVHIFQVYSSPNIYNLEINLISFLKGLISKEAINNLESIADARRKRYLMPKNEYALYKNYCLHDLFNRLPGRYLPKVDLAAAFNSIEIRSPYLDDKLISQALKNNLNGDSSLLGKPILKKLLLEDFPHSFVYKKKMGFSPKNSLINNETIIDSLISIKEKNISLEINEIAEAYIQNPNLKNHWYSESIIWNLICINAWYSA